MFKKLKILILLLAFLSVVGGLMTQEAFAADCAAGNTTTCTPVNKRSIDCASGKVDSTDPTKCAPLGNGCNGNSANTCLKNSPITTNLNNIINFLSAGVGIIVVGVIILGGIQYSLAGDNPSAVTAAKQRIVNGLLALVVFMFIFAFVQWLVPGGIFS